MIYIPTKLGRRPLIYDLIRKLILGSLANKALEFESKNDIDTM